MSLPGLVFMRHGFANEMKTRLGVCVKNLWVRVRLCVTESLAGLGLCVIVATTVRRNTDWVQR